MEGLPGSRLIYEKAQELMPGGVSSPIRAFGAVEGEPVALWRGQGPYVWDADGNRYVDYVLSWGPLILGHADPDVVAVIKEQAELGSGFGAVTSLEVVLAKLINEAIPDIEQIRFVNSGTEATMSAVRLARGYTGRDKIIVFSGSYHGHADSLLVGTKTGIAFGDGRSSAGVTAATTADTLVAPYNGLEKVEEILESEGERVAAIIVEPMAANMGLVLPEDNFLPGLRRLTWQYGVVLIFDEVLSGFRVVYGGGEAVHRVKPDLITLGKVIGGGLPVGAYGGRREIMEHVAPMGRVFQAGSQAGNAIGMAAGIAQLRKLKKPGVYEQLADKTQRLVAGIRTVAEAAGVPLVAQAQGSIFGLSFQEGPIKDYQTAIRTNREMFKRWFWGMLRRGVYLAPGSLEVGYMSLSHAEREIEATMSVAEEVFGELKE
ncbi:MAG: glutamate-1-semialdehyde 2,1-aminomutase [Candidatus Chisholmbacteria bacterium]|nr:glutamate-1-semialdehyde 2,1-aminomutase [Candidatus Chisholmbacteria bacterium]